MFHGMDVASDGRVYVTVYQQGSPRILVIAADGQSPIQKTFDPGRYPLKITYSLSGDPDQVSSRAEIHRLGFFIHMRNLPAWRG